MQAIGPMSGVGLVVTLCAIFMIVLMAARKTLEGTSFFGDSSAYIVAACVAALSVLGILRFFGPPDQATHVVSKPRTGRDLLDFILLGYAALAICILLGTAWPGAKPRHPNEGERSIVTEDTQRVKKETDDHRRVSSRERPGRRQSPKRGINK